jgi:phosphoesterase RecJ-like protein
MKAPKNLLAALKREDKFLIAVHINPDGDALGSALALSTALESLGKETVVYSRDPVPYNYRFLPGHSRITSDLNKAAKTDPVIVLLDCNSPERAGLEKYTFRKSIVIDHHETETDFGDVRWIDSGAAATGMMVYCITKGLGVKVTEDMAVNLYTSVVVDTGTFRYSNTSADVLRVGAELVDAGAKPHLIADILYESWPRKQFELLVLVLNTLKIKDNIAVSYVTTEMFRKTGTRSDDTENFSNFPRMIDTVKISAFFRDIGNGAWKVSLRSKGEVNVARVAEAFGGGGHKNAAGFRITGDFETARAALLKAARKIR